jgi:Cyanobacterial TRADD-N associated 2-Transmembrane domain
MASPALQIHKARTSDASIEELQMDCGALAQAAPGNTQKIGALMLRMILRYYADVRSQARQSFYAALGAAVVGTGFFVWIARSSSGGLHASLAALAGSLIQVISGINFYLYFKVSRQFAGFHMCLERTNRFLLANTFCENLSETNRDVVRAELVKLVADAPMLTMDILAGEPARRKQPRRVVSAQHRSNDGVEQDQNRLERVST